MTRSRPNVAGYPHVSDSIGSDGGQPAGQPGGNFWASALQYRLLALASPA